MLNILSILLLMMNIVVPAPVPAPPAAPRPGVHRFAMAGDGQTQTTIITTTDNNRTVRIEVRGDNDISASIDGVAVPPERVVREGDTVRVLDEKGATIATFSVAGGRGGVWATAPQVFRGVVGPRPMIGVMLGRVDDALAAQIGVRPNEVILITDVTPERPAAKAGVQRFDVVTGINDKSPVTEDDLREAVRAGKSGDTILLRVLRKGQSHDIAVVIEESEPLARVWNDKAAEELMRAQELATEGMAQARARMHAAQRLWENQKINWEDLREKLAAELREAATKLSDEERAKIEESIRNLTESLRNLDISIDLPRIQIFRGEGDDDVLMVRPATPAPPSSPRIGTVGPGSEQRLRTLEERMARIEELLERLVKSRESNPEQ